MTFATPGTQSITGTQSGIMVRSIYQVWGAARSLAGNNPKNQPSMIYQRIGRIGIVLGCGLVSPVTAVTAEPLRLENISGIWGQSPQYLGSVPAVEQFFKVIEFFS